MLANSWSSRFNAVNLVSFNCRVSKSWDGDDTWFAFDSYEEKSGTIMNKDTLLNRPRFKSIFFGIGGVPVELVYIQLTNDAIPVQRPACRVLNLNEGEIQTGDQIYREVRNIFKVRP